MLGYFNRKISSGLAFALLISAAIVCIVIVRVYYLIVIKEIDNTQKIIQEIGE